MNEHMKVRWEPFDEEHSETLKINGVGGIWKLTWVKYIVIPHIIGRFLELNSHLCYNETMLNEMTLFEDLLYFKQR